MQRRESRDSLGMENSAYYIRKLLTGKCIFGNDGRRQEGPKIQWGNNKAGGVNFSKQVFRLNGCARINIT